MTSANKITGVVFTDLGQGASFMGLDWVQSVIRERVGFAPYPGTLNLRLQTPEAVTTWENLRRSLKGIDIPPAQNSFCSARCFKAGIDGVSSGGKGDQPVAVLVPEVEDYPPDKLEVIAPFHIKASLGIKDGDLLVLEFVGK